MTYAACGRGHHGYCIRKRPNFGSNWYDSCACLCHLLGVADLAGKWLRAADLVASIHENTAAIYRRATPHYNDPVTHASRPTSCRVAQPVPAHLTAADVEQIDRLCAQFGHRGGTGEVLRELNEVIVRDLIAKRAAAKARNDARSDRYHERKRAMAKAAGLCSACFAPTVDGAATCPRHQAQARASWRARQPNPAEAVHVTVMDALTSVVGF